MKNEPNESEVVRMPLWRACLDKMRDGGITYGQTFSSDFFETELRCKRDVMQFALSVSEIRRELLADGFYLSGRGYGGNQFVILAPESNAEVMTHYARKAADALKRGVILGTNTRLDTLNDNDRRRHEAILERMAIKCALIQRSKKVADIIAKSHPKLLAGLRTNDAEAGAGTGASLLTQIIPEGAGAPSNTNPKHKMIPQVFSLDEARDWFLSHSSGSVMCVKCDEQRECNCYPDAKAFYEPA